MYYFIVMIAVLLFGGCFAFKDFYRKLRGASGMKMALETTLFGSVGGTVVLSAVNCISTEGGLRFDIGGLYPGFTPFTFFMAALAALNGFAFTFCSFKALDRINLSLFSLFSMTGGVLLPFVHGIAFYGEELTLAKAVCMLLILAAIIMTLDFKKSSERKGGYIYYIGIFIFNGMSGVLSKIFSSSTLPKTTDAGYSVWLSIISGIVSAAILLLFFREKEKGEVPLTVKAVLLSGSSGALNKLANFLLVLALSGGIDASAQYPLVTGGVMIISTLLCFFTERKPNKKEVLSIFFAFLGTLALFVIPI